MKKFVFTAAAAMTLSAPAFADFTLGNDERSVTVYGRADLGVVHQNSGTSFLSQAGGSLTAGDSQLHPGADSWFGLNAEMKLGDDLRSYIKVQQRFRADTGAQLNSASEFYGWSYVGLRKIGIGAIELGRQYVPAAYVMLNADPFRWDTVATISNLSFGASKNYNGYVATDLARYKNGAYFKSDSVKGFKVVLGYSFQQDNSLGQAATTSAAVTPDKKGVGNEFGGTVEYQSGSAYAGLGFDRTSSNASGANLAEGQNLRVLTLAYDFGVIKPMLSATRTTVGVALGALHSSVYTLGAVAPIGGGELKAVAAKVRQQGPAAQDLSKLGVGYHYWLKKVSTPTESYGTKLYTDVSTALGNGQTRTNAIDVGLMVTF